MADPVSDFLAREQDALAGLDDDFAPAAQPNNDAESVIQNGLGLNGAAQLQNGINHDYTNDSGVDLNALGNMNETTASSMQNGRGVSPSVSINSGGRSSSVPVEKEEPEKIRKWRENQKQLIADKDKAEEKKKEELREQAKKELEEWHAQRNARLEQRKKDNRERETQHFEASENNGDTNTWERISKLVESKGNRGGTKDTSRMKTLFTQYAEAPPTSTA